MDKTIDMAREAGELKCDCCLPYYEETDIEGFEGFLKRFEALVRADERNRTWTQEHWTEYERSIAAAEREACAKVCDSLEEQCEKLLVPDEKWPTPSDCAHIIRARGNT